MTKRQVLVKSRLDKLGKSYEQSLVYNASRVAIRQAATISNLTSQLEELAQRLEALEASTA